MCARDSVAEGHRNKHNRAPAPKELGLEDRQGSGLINSWLPGEGGSLSLLLCQHLLSLEVKLQDEWVTPAGGQTPYPLL